MKNLKDAKEIYDHIVVPEELEERLKKTLENAPAAKKNTSNNVVKFTRWAATAAADKFFFHIIRIVDAPEE